MDLRFDQVSAVRDKKYKYIRNYLPHLPNGRPINYMWKVQAMASWQKEYDAGRTNEIQSRFFETRNPEELYDITIDPHEVNNLASDPKYKDVLIRMRQENKKHLLKIRDTGFLPEEEMIKRSKGSTPRDICKDKNKYDLDRIITAAELASERNPDKINQLVNNLKDKDSVVRYWGAIGLRALGDDAKTAEDNLISALADDSASVSIAAAEALCVLGNTKAGLPVYKKHMESDNVWAAHYAADSLDASGIDIPPNLLKTHNKVQVKVQRITGLNVVKYTEKFK